MPRPIPMVLLGLVRIRLLGFLIPTLATIPPQPVINVIVFPRPVVWSLALYKSRGGVSSPQRQLSSRQRDTKAVTNHSGPLFKRYRTGQKLPTKKMKLLFVLASLFAAAHAQISIGAPTSGATVQAGQNVTIQIIEPIDTVSYIYYATWHLFDRAIY